MKNKNKSNNNVSGIAHISIIALCKNHQSGVKWHFLWFQKALCLISFDFVLCLSLCFPAPTLNPDADFVYGKHEQISLE